MSFTLKKLSCSTFAHDLNRTELKVSFKKDNKENNLEVFKSYFDKYFDDIRNFLYYKSSDEDLAEDLAQEVFLKLWENYSKLNHAKVKSYLYTIASNLFKNHYNRKKVEFRFKSSLYDLDYESPQYILEYKEFDRLLQNTIGDIPEKSREVFLMNRIDKLTYNEIGARLNISVKAVEKRMRKALEIISNLTQHKV